jgi:hypothetical protein
LFLAKPGRGNFGTLPCALPWSKKFDLNGNELTIISLSDINNKKYRLEKITMIFEPARLLLFNNTEDGNSFRFPWMDFDARLRF